VDRCVPTGHPPGRAPQVPELPAVRSRVGARVAGDGPASCVHQVANDWVESFGLAATQPSAIVSVLKWLGIVDQKGASLGVWDDVRIASSRQAKLGELVRKSYDAIFDQFDEVSKASMEDLRGAFIRAYKSGDPGRPITCFIELCNQAGIPISAQPKTRRRKETHGKPSVSKRPTKTVKTEPGAPGASGKKRHRRPTPRVQQGVTISVNVEIPAEWSEEQIRERLDVVRRATEGGGAT
jgi:hypothetical protein